MSILLPSESDRRILTLEDEELNPVLEDRRKFIGTFHDLASSGIGEDRLIKDAFLGFIFNEAQNGPIVEPMQESGENQNGLLYIMQDARVQRSQDPNFPLRRIHAALVALYGANHIFMNVLGDQNYPTTLNLNSPSQWQSEVWKKIQDDPILLDEFTRIVFTKELNTSDPNRGNDFAFISRRVHGDKPLDIGDLGASFGFPWARVACTDCDDLDPYSCNDKTTYKGKTGLLREQAQHPLNINKIVLVDHVDPRDDIDWFLANDYPKNINPAHIEKKKKRIERYTQVPNIEFRKGNMIDNPPLEPYGSDIVSVIMAGYELPWHLQQALIHEILPTYTDTNGLQIVKDYLKVDSKGNLLFTNERKPFTCATAVRGEVTNNQWMIVTRHSSSRCSETRNGEHFERFIDATEHLPHNQTSE